MPFVFAIDREPVEINKENTVWFHCFCREMPEQSDAALGNAAEVRLAISVFMIPASDFMTPSV
jgi:hypothetical protein